MTKGRLEAFSDGVMAILITIMVLELPKPATPDWAGFRHELKHLGAYAMSFVALGIYWNNHHHLLHTCSRVNGAVLWANTHLLFWLSLVPWTTGWVIEEGFSPVPVAVYAALFFFAGLGWNFLIIAIVRLHGRDSTLARAIGRDWKGRLSGLGYAIATPIALAAPMVAIAMMVAITLMWLIPDRRIERALLATDKTG